MDGGRTASHSDTTHASAPGLCRPKDKRAQLCVIDVGMSSQHAIGLGVLSLGTLDDERRPGHIVIWMPSDLNHPS